MAIIKCPECGHEVSDRAKTCPHCGVDIAGQIITCPDCGEVIFKDAAVCTNCQCPINGSVQTYDTPPVRTTESDKTAVPTDEQKAVRGKQQPRRKVKRTYTALVVSAVIALIVVLLGLYFYQTTEQQNELHAYENAIASGEPAVLQNFLDIYAEAPKAHRDTIVQRLEALKKIDLEWDAARASLSKAELQRYVNRHPGNIHVTEARLLIDSLDWQAALADGTADAFQLYLDEHGNGAHVDEARDRFEKLDALRLKSSDRDMLRQLMHSFFDALAQKDEATLRATVTENLWTFMAKEQATADDVVRYMHTLYEPGDITNIAFTILDNWKIEKKPTETEGQFTFTATFGVEKRIERSNQELERFASYKTTVRVNPAGRIVSLNMQKTE